MDLQIGRFSRPLFWVTGTPVYLREKLLEMFGTPVKTCFKVAGTPVKKSEILSIVIIFKSDLLRLWRLQLLYVALFHIHIWFIYVCCTCSYVPWMSATYSSYMNECNVLYVELFHMWRHMLHSFICAHICCTHSYVHIWKSATYICWYIHLWRHTRLDMYICGTMRICRYIYVWHYMCVIKYMCCCNTLQHAACLCHNIHVFDIYICDNIHVVMYKSVTTHMC